MSSTNIILGSKIVGDPVNPIYSPVPKIGIDELNMWVSDQNNRSLNIQGETIILTFHISHTLFQVYIESRQERRLQKSINSILEYHRYFL